MGYTFTIGNATPQFANEYGELRAWWEVEGRANDDAPVFVNDEMTGNSNSRSPSYSAWSDFCKQAGIYSLFYDECGHLIGGHPGCILINKDMLETVQHALTSWKATHNKEPGFEGWSWQGEASESKYDAILARLIWMEYWMRWALENCETPAIENT